jgi:GNAT superfamily N-acetyltransferase
MSDHEVRRARRDDVDAMGRAMAKAFAHDPLMAWVLPDEARRVKNLTRWFASFYRSIGLKRREVYTTENVHGVAEWAPPGEWKLSPRVVASAVPASIRWLGPGALRLVTAMNTLERKHPTTEHWYLEGLGTDPSYQRQGIGGALMKPVLDRCDIQGVPAYLETQNPDNVPYYQRFGFKIADELDLPKGGPHMWLMWREP